MMLYTNIAEQIYEKISEDTVDFNSFLNLIKYSYNFISQSSETMQCAKILHNKFIDIALSQYLDEQKSIILGYRFDSKNIEILKEKFLIDPSDYKNVYELGIEYNLVGNYTRSKQLLNRVSNSEYKEKKASLLYLQKHLKEN